MASLYCDNTKSISIYILLTQNKEGILPVWTERAWLMWPNKLFRGRECTPMPQRCTERCIFEVFNTQSNGHLVWRFLFW